MKSFSRSVFKREIIAGLTSFSTMVYILIVNPLILADGGVDFASALLATVAIAFMGSCLMGLVADYPFALAPGVGMAAYFTYSVVLGAEVSVPTAFGIVFISGIILLFLWVTGLRELIISGIPRGLKIATTSGIGLFLVLIGFKNSKIIVAHAQTLIALGDLKTPEVLLAALGIVLIAALITLRFSAALLCGVLFCWIGGLIFGVVKWKGIFGLPNFSSQTFLALDIPSALNHTNWLTIFSFLFIGLFDVSGSLMGLAHQGKFLDSKGHLPRLHRALFPDAFCTTCAGLLGSSSCSVFIESASGIAAGGKTGITAITVGLLFLLTIFFEPLAASIPIFAVTPVLIVIGALMLQSVIDIDWKDPTEFIPAFMIIVGIPLTYSIGTGIGFGILLYPLCKLLAGKWREVHWLTWILAALFAVKFTLD